jgi:hypothetical protein
MARSPPRPALGSIACFPIAVSFWASSAVCDVADGSTRCTDSCLDHFFRSASWPQTIMADAAHGPKSHSALALGPGTVVDPPATPATSAISLAAWGFDTLCSTKMSVGVTVMP